MNNIVYCISKLYYFAKKMNEWQKDRQKTSKILRKVEQLFDRGNCTSWRNRDFEDLSFAIHQKTKILISAATLKRIFGKVKTNSRYKPQEGTLNALIEYCNIDITQLSTSPARPKWPYLVFPSLGLLLLLITFIWILPTLKTEKSITASVQLQKIEGRCPSSAFFNLSIPDSNTPIFIQYGDGSDPVLINDREKVNHFYGQPGHYAVWLETEKRRITKPIKVFVPSDGWKVFAQHYNSETDKRYYPVPIEQNVRNEIFHASKKSLSDLGLNTSEIITINLSNFRKTDLNGDSFVFSSRFKNDSFWPAIRCYSAYVTIEGSRGKILFKFMGEGCSAYGEYWLSEQHETGSTGDLTPFAIDLKQWTDVEIVNQNKTVSVKLNDTSIFSKTYQKTIGDILGTSITFHGSGSVEYLFLSQNNTDIFKF